MRSKITAYEEIVKSIEDGMQIMIGGFLADGTPELLIDAVIESGAKNLTIIGNDTGVPGRGISRLIDTDQVARVITSHVGLNPRTIEKAIAGTLDLQLVPQGTLAEQIRCAGAGLGGALTPTGLGTKVAEGKRQIEVQGKTYLLEEPLHADLALLKSAMSDEFGNSFYEGTCKNFNIVMAYAADTVIVECDQLLEIGDLNPNTVETSGILVDHLIKGAKCDY
ncbi:MAG: 3-oxoacid CoA-transferase subunit A [Eubacteriales bacterium]|nr:3-oxoacid CoA-transferase subunit A [Eubacteriales bacterium]MDD4323568.1 3-oxoacid CoA-transferase subunit A [Eubacteriales bacterium]MDD4541091.1 3-oxoacid CoA-transferase subunit A [Eubacteriales bacterium]